MSRSQGTKGPSDTSRGPQSQRTAAQVPPKMVANLRSRILPIASYRHSSRWLLGALHRRNERRGLDQWVLPSVTDF